MKIVIVGQLSCLLLFFFFYMFIVWTIYVLLSSTSLYVLFPQLDCEPLKADCLFQVFFVLVWFFVDRL